MHPRHSEIVAAARECVGTRTRPQGRRPGLAMDCIGVALWAGRGAGLNDIGCRDYAIASDNRVRLERGLEAAGLKRVEPFAAGDLAQMTVAGNQHLAVLTGVGAIHAHFGVGRVVEAPLPAEWTLVAAWRFPEVR